MDDKIPKIIHYVWLGKNKIPDYLKNNIESWKKYNKDYEIMEWNDNKIPEEIKNIPYFKQAMQKERYAFASDIVRLYALNKYGGIYLDTDVECIKSFDPYLNNPGILCFEGSTYFSNAVMASVKNNPLFIKFLDSYKDVDFISKNKNKWGCGLELKTGPVRITKVFLKYYKIFNIRESLYNFEHITLYPSEYFSPNIFKENTITENTITIHKFEGSWKDNEKYTFTLPQKIFFKILEGLLHFHLILGTKTILNINSFIYERKYRYNKKNRNRNKNKIKVNN